MATDLPDLLDRLVIHFNLRGHVSIYYKGTRINSSGVPGEGLTSFVRSQDKVAGGVLFVTAGLGERFRKDFDEYIARFVPRQSLTCVGCTSLALQDLGLLAIAPIEFLSPVHFFEHLVNLSLDQENGISIMTLGIDLPAILGNLHSREEQFKKGHAHPGGSSGSRSEPKKE